MKFSAYAGDISIDTSHIKTFAQTWYDKDDIVVLVAISVDGLKRRKVLSQAVPVSELIESTPDEIQDLCVIGAEKFSTYISIFPVKEENNVNFYSRGTKEDIKSIYGVFADLDIKEGSFTDKQDIMDFLMSLQLEPTILVDNGANGGMHAYWRLDDELATEDLLFMWWCYLQSKTDKKIDRLADSTRISRMPSGIYWPKPDSDGVSDTIKVIKSNGPKYKLKTLEDISHDAYEARKKKVNDTIEQNRMSKEEAGQVAVKIFSEYRGDGYPWSVKLAISKLEDVLNAELTWDEILTPFGWTMRRELKEGDGREWARPGQEARSAVTDYVKDDGTVTPVMSLLSRSDDTGLADLWEAGIPLTKYQVLLKLEYEGDEKAMLIDMKERIIK